jgi:IS30 family transposase
MQSLTPMIRVKRKPNIDCLPRIRRSRSTSHTPQRPWEQDTSKNTNGLIGPFFPKDTDFSQVSHYRIKRVLYLLNERPRKVRHRKTPVETFKDLFH